MSQDELIDNATVGATDEPAETAEPGGEGEPGLATSERKPLSQGTLLLFGVVLAGACGAYFMYLRSSPATASGAAVTASHTISAFLESDSRNVANMQQTLRQTQKVVDEFRHYPNVPEVPLQANPFRDVTPGPTSVLVDDAAARKRHDEVRKAVSGLQMQSILHSGAYKACMINNTLYQEGQSVDGFRVERINADSVVVSNSGYRFELRMQR